MNGLPQYAYQCYKQISTGTVKTRMNKGLSLEGICRSPMVPGWKLGAMADIIFQNFWKDRDGVIKIANEMLDKHYTTEQENDFADEIEDIGKKLKTIEKKFDNLVEMRMAGEIDKKMFDEKKESLNNQKEKLTNQLFTYQVEEEVSEDDYEKRLEVLKYGLEENFNFSTHSIPEEVIDAFVNEIIVYEDCFVWKLNLFDDTIKMNVDGRKNNATVSLVESPLVDNSSSGSYHKQIGVLLNMIGVSLEIVARLFFIPIYPFEHPACSMYHTYLWHFHRSAVSPPGQS